MTWKYNKGLTILLMVPLVSLYAFSLDLYLPLLPAVAKDLQATKAAMQYGNSLFMLVCGIGQLIFGPLSDRFGRRPVLLGSLVVYLIGSLILSTFSSLPLFILARGLQAFGSCGTYLCCFASIRDIFTSDTESTEMFSYLNISLSLGAITGPTVGALIGTTSSWHTIFAILSLHAIISGMYSLFFYHETAPTQQSQQASAYQRALAAYKEVFASMDYHVYTLPAAVGIGSFFSFYCMSSYLYQEVMHISPLNYGLLYGSCGLIFFVGSFLCGQTVKRVGIQKTLWAGLACHMLGALVVTGSFIITGQSLLVPTHIGVLMIILGSSYMISAGIGGTMAPFQHIAGAAFALISAYKFIFAQILADIVMRFYAGNAEPFGIALILANITAAAVLLLGKPYITSTRATTQEA
jgi:DHA1 family florfenicol/chloramphenicol resistance protein-like MFS transporter